MIRIAAIVRVAALFALLLVCWIDGVLRRPRSATERAAWNQAWCCRVLRCLGIRVGASGPLPAHGLVVSNHLSYVDVLVLGALQPTVFVSKLEVRSWPLLGALTARSGTVYLNRQSPRAAVAANRQIESTLRIGLPVVLFPEGTTTAGDRLLPFHAALFDPAIRAAEPIHPAAIAYANAAGTNLAPAVAYHGEDTLLPHLLRLAELRDLHAEVVFSPSTVHAANRAAAAEQSYRAVRGLMMHAAAAPVSSPADDRVSVATHHPAAA